MKKVLILAMAAAMLLSLCACSPAATTEPTTNPTPSTNKPTDPTNGTTQPTDPTDPSNGIVPCQHQFSDATCMEPATCSLCGTTEGDALGHSYTNGVCTVCEEADPLYHALTTGMWYSLIPNGVGGNSLGCIEFTEDGQWWSYSWKECITYEEYLALADIEEPGMPEGLQWYYKLIEISGVTYAVKWQQEAVDGGEYTVEGDTLTMEVLSFADGENMVSVRLDRISGNEFQITDSSIGLWDVLGYYPYPQDDVLTWGDVVFELSDPLPF